MVAKLNGCSENGKVNSIADWRAQCDSKAMPEGSIAGRLKRVTRSAVQAFAALLFIMAGSPTIAQQPQRIVAVGDLHGDYKAWQDIARGAGLINAKGHWTGGKTILVQLGDVADREPDTLKIIKSLQQLEREAARKGGKVHVVLGNHEAMNLLGDNRYTTPGEYAAFVDSQSAARRDRVYEANRAQVESFYRTQDPKATPEQVRATWMSQHPLGWVEHKLAWSPTGELGQWAARNPAILKIGNVLFTHGGISAEYAKQPIDGVNKRVAAAMASADDSSASVLRDPLGPLWYRGLVAADPDSQAARAAVRPPAPPLTQEQELDAVLSAYGAQRLVIGHTPNLKGIQIINNGRLARIDTGNSRYYGGVLSWLEIVGDQMIPHTAARSP
jgi:Calcineurin-like phosphoesterase